MRCHEARLYWVFFFFLPLVLLFACPIAQAQTPCGLAVTQPNSGTWTTVLPSNYSTFYNPGPSYTTLTMPTGSPGIQDTDFSATNPCTIIRMTQGDHAPTTDPNEVAPVSYIHSYKYTPINCDDTLELVGAGIIGSWTLLNIPAGTWLRDISKGIIPHDNNVSPIWAHCGRGNDAISKNTLYWHDVCTGTCTGGAKIYSYRADLDASTTLHDFGAAGETACGGGPCTGVCWGCSRNGPHQGIVSPDDVISITGHGSNGNWYAFEWDLYNNVRVTTFASVLSSIAYPIAAVYPDHRMVLQYNDGVTGRAGFNLYDSTGTFVRAIPDSADQHNEEQVDLNGKDVIYEDGTNVPGSNVCPHQSGLIKYTVDLPLTITCLADVGWGGKHISATQDGQWVALEEEVGNECTNAYYNANPGVNWQAAFTNPTGFSTTTDEIVLAKSDGSVVYRLTHDRTRGKDNATCTGNLTSISGYWAQPKTAISYDGKYIAFTSNMGIALTTSSGQGSYTDEFLVVTGLGGNSSSGKPNPPTGLTAIVH